MSEWFNVEFQKPALNIKVELKRRDGKSDKGCLRTINGIWHWETDSKETGAHAYITKWRPIPKPPETEG